jgi:ankyrin repeat protein
MILDKRAMINAGNKGGDTALHIAVRTNQKENGEVLISRGADIFAANFAGESSLYLALTSSGGIREWLFNDKTAKATDGLGNSVLHYAAQWKLDSFIPFIIQKGTSVDAANVTGETPLFWSVKYDSPSTVRVLLNNRANIDARDILGNSALHAAVRWNAKNSANALIDSGININTHSLSGNTPLHEAVRLGATEMEILLISRGANLEIRNADGNTPFMEAVMTGNSMSMNRLASAGADPMTRNARGDTPLHIAVSIERYDIINTLLVLGSSIHARNTRSRTPFQTGLGISEQMVSSLLTIDQINTSDNYGNSPLHIALQEEAPASIISLIISCGGRLTAVDSNGRTPLRLAVDSGNWQSAKVLADAGADPFAAAVDGKNAAEIAIAKGRDAIDALFSGRAVSARDNSGNNILHYAARLGTPQLISRLMELGADKNTRNIASERPVDIALRWNLTENAALLQN